MVRLNDGGRVFKMLSGRRGSEPLRLPTVAKLGACDLMDSGLEPHEFSRRMELESSSSGGRVWVAMDEAARVCGFLD